MTVDPWAEIARLAPYFGLELDDQRSLNAPSGAFVYISRPAETANLLEAMTDWSQPVLLAEVLANLVRLNAG